MCPFVEFGIEAGSLLERLRSRIWIPVTVGSLLMASGLCDIVFIEHSVIKSG
jgi:hypothetical protein